jgi:acetyl esterase/lipase
MKKLALGLLVTLSYMVNVHAAQEDIIENIPYYDEATRKADPYIQSRSVLDLYCPKSKEPLPTIVWFHGGGLSGGEKEIIDTLRNKGVCIVSPNYRLHPKVKSPIYIEDAAAAVAWVFKNIHSYGGDPSKIFISGHSAGGYLASMVGLDKKWLAAHNVDANKIAGLIPFSGHTITHFTVRKEMGIDGKQPIIDAMAPLFHVRADAPPLLLITGDREMEMLGRYEENAYMMRMMKVVGHKHTRLLELDGYGHNIVEPALPLLLKEVIKVSKMTN